MKLIEVSIKEFEEYAKNHELTNFHQTSNWANLKKTNHWKAHYLVLKDNNEIKAAALLLKKKLPIINKYMFYSPRGFLIDYKDKSLLEEFTKLIKGFSKENKAIFVKIDPYLNYQQRNQDGNIIKNGFNNQDCLNNLKSLGYKHYGLGNKPTLQPRWIYTLTTKNKSLEDLLKDMEYNTRRLIKKNETLPITTRELKKDELQLFKDVMTHTSKRREFIDRPLSYYESMYDNLKEHIKIVITEINFKEYITNLNNNLNKNIELLKELQDKEENNLVNNQKKHNNQVTELNKTISSIEKQLVNIKSYQQKYGDKTILGGMLFILYGNEVTSVFGGNYEELMSFYSGYTLNYEGIKYAVKNNYQKYNFYGIDGNFKEENNMTGLHTFKKSFSGQVEELIGEFDLIVSPISYRLYKILFKIYKLLKK